MTGYRAISEGIVLLIVHFVGKSADSCVFGKIVQVRRGSLHRMDF